jgi:hypothetical protein
VTNREWYCEQEGVSESLISLMMPRTFFMKGDLGDDNHIGSSAASPTSEYGLGSNGFSPNAGTTGHLAKEAKH